MNDTEEPTTATGAADLPGAIVPGESHPVAVAAARAADEKGATDVVALEVGPILGICESFVIASGRNTRQVKAIADEVEEQLRVLLDRKPRSIEGTTEQRWILLDFGDVIVHVFLDTEREFYRLERLYRDAPRIDWAPTD